MLSETEAYVVQHTPGPIINGRPLEGPEYQKPVAQVQAQRTVREYFKCDSSEGCAGDYNWPKPIFLPTLLIGLPLFFRKV